MKIAIMQPYIFPYIGYFQLINAVDKFIFYDDVNFKKKGFINRNSILVNGISNPFTISCKSISQNSLIKDVVLDFDIRARQRFLKTLKLAYTRAPHFETIYPMLEDFIVKNTKTSISDFAIDSVWLVARFLDLNKTWVKSSIEHAESRVMDKTDRLIDIIKKEGADHYINLAGGKALYDPGHFKKHNISIEFLETKFAPYKQFKAEFIPSLSIIDVLMFNSRDKIKLYLNEFSLE